MSMYENVTLTFRDAELDHVLNDTSGDVGRHMSRIGDQILRGARRMVGIRTGRLIRSLYKRHERTARGQVVIVGARANHAYLHHEGADPHVIAARGGRVLRFNQGGRVVYARRVFHPGFRGNKYLTVPMERAVRG